MKLSSLLSQWPAAQPLLWLLLAVALQTFSAGRSGMVEAKSIRPPAPYGAVPSAAQLAWHRRELIAFVHFNMNTFTGSEWGSGKEDTALFNPTQLDCAQWVSALKAAGVRQVILTAKHHDGFCLWPSAYTGHSVKNSPWKGGKGDVVREFTDACRAGGVKTGLYLSPWDRNSPVYGDSPRYNDYYEKQLTELLTRYGEISEVWMDGANGEGPNGKHQIYDWPAFTALLHRLAPNAVVFQCEGNTRNSIRWVGNEAGIAPATNWNADGGPHGTVWNPAECDVSIRPGWFYHSSEDNSVKSLDRLLTIYYASVGHGSVLLLNVPPDRRGRFADADVQRLKEFGEAVHTIFAHDLAAHKAVTATNVRGGSERFAASNVVSGKSGAYWAADDDVHTASLEVNLGAPTAFNNVVLQEYIPLGQRVETFTVEGQVDGTWQPLATGTTIGYKRILWFPTVTASKLRVNITQSLACPTLSRIGIFRGPYEAPVVPVSVIQGKPAAASDVHGNQTEFGADKAVDGDPDTRWATNDAVRQCWLQVDAGRSVKIGRVSLREFDSRIRRFELQYKITANDAWQTALSGTDVGPDYAAVFPPVEARYIRLSILDATGPPTLYEFQVFAPNGSIPPSH